MNFSRFFSYLILFFFAPLLVTNARPRCSDISFFSTGQPLAFEAQKFPFTSTSSYRNILIDKNNHLFISNEHSVFIYDGNNYQQVNIPGNPTIFSDNENIFLGGDNYLSILTPTQNGHYSLKQLVNAKNLQIGQITKLGFDKKNVVFTSNSKLWVYNDRFIAIDSSDRKIDLYNTSEGTIAFIPEKGFFRIENDSKTLQCKSDQIEPNGIINVVSINKHLIAISKKYPWTYDISGNSPSILKLKNLGLNPNDRVEKSFVTNSYLFLCTSSGGLLMLDLSNESIYNFDSQYGFFSDQIEDICSNDGITFYALSKTQVRKFINPLLVETFDSRSGINGTINALASFEETLYVATSSGLFALNSSDNNLIFNSISSNEFYDLVVSERNLFAIGRDGVYNVNKTASNKIYTTKEEQAFFIKSKSPKLVLLSKNKLSLSDLTSPLKLEDVKSSQISEPLNVYPIDSLILIRTSNLEYYWLNTSEKNPILQKCTTYVSPSNQEIISIDTNRFAVIDGQAFRIKSSEKPKTSSNANVFVRSLANGLLFNYLSDFSSTNQLIEIYRKTEIPLLRSLNLSSAAIDSDSCIWLSSSNRLVRISPDLIKKHKAPKNLAISVFSFSTIYKDSSNTLQHGFIDVKNNVYQVFNVRQGSSIDITLGSTYIEDVAYSVKFDGHHKDWSDWSTERKYFFNKLKSGKYNLYVRAKDISGKISEASLIIYLTPSFFQTDIALLLFIILVILSTYTFFRWRNYNHALEKFNLERIIKRRTDELVREKEKTDNLLARVLPPETATELKETGKVNTQKFNVVTVLFSDIQGFTKITDETNPENLIDQLDKFFLYFDAVVEKYKIEKIKTIGDAYMCAGGIPQKNRTNPIEVVLAALEMMHYMKEINKQLNPGQNIWDLRIGIDTGPVIAGVVGRSKLTYDIWGSTVNTASRMESSGEVGKINISGNTYLLVQDYFICSYRGKMPIKNKGDIEMYFVEGIKPTLSENLNSIKPNQKFDIQLQLIRLGDLEEFVLEKLDKGLPKNLYYHNLKHTVDVYTEVELIGRSENVSDEELLLLRTAALLHDAGHMIDYDTHEEMGVKLAREILPEFYYSERQIEIISELIMVTKLPPRPKNLLEAIICDSDLDYLGRTDFIPVSNMLYKELHEHGKIGSEHEWNEMQIKFIEKHQYFTNTARRLRNVNKKSQLENIKEWMKKNKI